MSQVYACLHPVKTRVKRVDICAEYRFLKSIVTVLVGFSVFLAVNLSSSSILFTALGPLERVIGYFESK
jgi:hypothetical protein